MESPKDDMLPDDEEVLLYLAEGTHDERCHAFEQVLCRYTPSVTRFVSSKLFQAVERQDAADIVMETFESLWALVASGKVDLGSNLEALLIKIAKGRIGDYLERRMARKRTPPTKSEEADLLIDALYGTALGTQCVSVDVRIVEDALRNLVPGLPDIQRRVAVALLSRYPEIITPAEVHEACLLLGFGLTYVQVKNALPALFAQIRSRLSALGGDKR